MRLLSRIAYQYEYWSAWAPLAVVFKVPHFDHYRLWFELCHCWASRNCAQCWLRSLSCRLSKPTRLFPLLSVPQWYPPHSLRAYPLCLWNRVRSYPSQLLQRHVLLAHLWEECFYLPFRSLQQNLYNLAHQSLFQRLIESSGLHLQSGQQTV